jgi:Holliday junction resolvasome RuvABC endonuclease subunit
LKSGRFHQSMTFFEQALSSFKTHKINGAPVIRNKKEWVERLTTLKTTIDKHLQTIPEKAITIENLYFNA